MSPKVTVFERPNKYKVATAINIYYGRIANAKKQKCKAFCAERWLLSVVAHRQFAARRDETVRVGLILSMEV